MYWLIGIGLVVLVLGVFIYRRYKMFAPAFNKDAKVSEKLINLTDKNFKTYVKHGVSLVDFWAEWCQPCKLQGPVVSQLADELSANGIKICKLDVENNKRISQELGIKNIPTIIIFKNGKPIEKFVGLKGKSVLLKAMNKAIDK